MPLLRGLQLQLPHACQSAFLTGITAALSEADLRGAALHGFARPILAALTALQPAYMALQPMAFNAFRNVCKQHRHDDSHLSQHHSQTFKVSRHVQRLIEAAETAERQLDPATASGYYEQLSAADPEHPLWLCLASKQW